MNKNLHFDIVIVGSGISGLLLARNLAIYGKKVLVLSKDDIKEASTYYAQGGIASVFKESDSFESHISDTLEAGAGLCKKSVVTKVVKSAPSVINQLAKLGVSFSKNNDKTSNKDNTNNFHLAREGGHEHYRIVHVADHTGASIQSVLVSLAKKEKNITILPFHIVVSLVQAKNDSRQYQGVYALDIKQNKIKAISSYAVVLATGGAAKAYYYCTNPDVVTGDGIALGWQAGCNIANMEFMQFHPTCLYHQQDRSFLITEALRGFGAILRNPSGEPFAKDYDERGELAPRDIVARAIDAEMKKKSFDFVCLDLTHLDEKKIMYSFPTIFKRCLAVGINICKQQIPVVPAAHYTCGGIKASLSGETNIEGIYAIGENACTGLHGANRLASNSLLEGACMANNTAQTINNYVSNKSYSIAIEPWDSSKVTNAREQVLILHNWDELRRIMWNLAGIVRSDEHLKRALIRIQNIKNEINDYYTNYKVSKDFIELRNLAIVSFLIVFSALNRRESRGLHYNVNVPDALPEAKDTVIKGCLENDKHTVALMD